MKLMIDANVILDVLCERDPFYYESAMVWDLCEAGEVEGCLSVLSFANMVYVMRSSKRDVQFIEKQLRTTRWQRKCAPILSSRGTHGILRRAQSRRSLLPSFCK